MERKTQSKIQSKKFSLTNEPISSTILYYYYKLHISPLCSLLVFKVLSNCLSFSPALGGQNGAGLRLPLAMLGSQGRQRPLLHMQRIPGPAFTHPSSAKKAWQLGGRYTSTSLSNTPEKPPNTYMDLVKKREDKQ